MDDGELKIPYLTCVVQKKGIHVVIAARFRWIHKSLVIIRISFLWRAKKRRFLHSRGSAIPRKKVLHLELTMSTRHLHVVITRLGFPQHKGLKAIVLMYSRLYARAVCRKNHIYYIFINVLQFWRFWQLSCWL